MRCAAAAMAGACSSWSYWRSSMPSTRAAWTCAMWPLEASEGVCMMGDDLYTIIAPAISNPGAW
jgi:hypothetical protein